MKPNNNSNEIATLSLSVLLRGLERCRQRVSAAPGGAAPPPLAEQWRLELAQCAEAETVAQLASATTPAALMGESAQALARLIAEAERLAAGTVAATPPTAATAPNAAPKGLTPVFSQIELETAREFAPRRFRWQPLTATREAEPPLLPVAGADVPLTEARQHLAALDRALNQLPGTLDWTNWEGVATHLLHLLQVYGWCMPADPASTPCDISIYDQTRTAAAIAACLLQAPPNTAGRCLLLTGGIYGIQEYLYDISTIGAGGVAKRLRARSFYVQLLTEAACLLLLRRFNLPLANLLTVAGGRFMLLLPNVPEAEPVLREMEGQFETWMLREFHGTLALKLAETPLAAAEFSAGHFGAALTRTQDRLRQAQSRWFAAALQGEGQWLTKEFLRAPFGEGEHDCKACHRFRAGYFSQQAAERNPEDLPDVCQQCHEQLLLGRALTRARYVSFVEPQPGLLNCFDALGVVVGDQPRAAAMLVLCLNNPDVSAAARQPVTFRYYANYIKRRNDSERTPWSFEEIAAQSELNEGERGAGLLGILKADVDWLSLVMQEGLRREPAAAGLDSLARLASVSRQFEWFFAGWLEWLMSQEVAVGYTVYSGGDDLLIVAPRARVLALAERIQQQFAAYTAHPDISLSAGIAVVKARLPLAHTVEEAERALAKAKESGRNKLCVLGNEVAWQTLPLVNEEIETLAAHDPPTALLYQFLRAARDWRRADDGYIEAWRYHARLAYQVARTLTAREQHQLLQWTTRLLELPAGAATRQLWRQLRLVTQWVLLGRKER